MGSSCQYLVLFSYNNVKLFDILSVEFGYRVIHWDMMKLSWTLIQISVFDWTIHISNHNGRLKKTNLKCMIFICWAVIEYEKNCSDKHGYTTMMWCVRLVNSFVPILCIWNIWKQNMATIKSLWILIIYVNGGI